MAYDEVGAGDFVSAETVNFIIQRQVNRPVCRVVLTANLSVANGTPTNVAFGSGTETNDDLGWHNTSVNTTRITPTYAGRYLIMAWGGWAANTTGDRRFSIYKNGVGYGAFDRVKSVDASGTTYCRVHDVFEADGLTDYFEMNVFQSAGVALNLLGNGDSSNSTGWSVTFLGEDT